MVGTAQRDELVLRVDPPRTQAGRLLADGRAVGEAGQNHPLGATWSYCNSGYALLGLVTYFTVGPKEARAWTIPTGVSAPQAAGVIHGDFERGFIRAETIGYDDYVNLGGEQAAKEAGRMRSEGKAYRVQDGDVLHFLFNA